MLVKLSQPSDVTPQRLNFDPSFTASGSDAVVIGYGATSEGGPSSFDLQEVKIPIVPYAECDSFWNKLDEATQICTGTCGFPI
jgi:Trypsin